MEKTQEVDLKKYKEPKSRITAVLPTSVRNEIARRAGSNGQTVSAYTSEKMIDACMNEDTLKNAQIRIEELETLLKESEEEKQNILVELEQLQNTVPMEAPKIETELDPDLRAGFKAQIGLLSQEIEYLKEENQELRAENKLFSEELKEQEIEGFVDLEDSSELEELQKENEQLQVILAKARGKIFEEIYFEEYEEPEEMPFLELLETALDMACKAYFQTTSHKNEVEALSKNIDFIEKKKQETCRWVKAESREAFKRALSYLSRREIVGFSKVILRKVIETYLDETKQYQSATITKYFDNIFNDIESNGI